MFLYTSGQVESQSIQSTSSVRDESESRRELWERLLVNPELEQFCNKKRKPIHTYKYLYQLTLLWETDLYIFLLVSCEREICTYVYWRPVRERFVHIYASFWWERDLCCTCLYHAAYMYCERERVVYIFFQCPVWERDLYTFVPASGEREICTVHMGTSLLWETDLYIFFRRPVRERVVHVYTSLQLEGELYCIYLYQLTVRERFVHICTSFRWERDLNCTYGYQLTVRKRLFIFVPTYWKREICTYWYQLPVREREICTVLTCTSLL